MSNWLNYNSIDGHNCLFNMIVGARNVGKTFGFKQKSINDFLKNGKKFIYMRRYDTELNDFNLYWADIAYKYPDHEFDIKGKIALIDKEEAGYAVNLSTGTTKKGVPYFGVNKINFDEFLISRGYHHYLKDEVKTFLEFYNTVVRMRENEKGELYQDDVKVYFTANNVSLTNPYFLEFGIDLNKNDFYKKDDILAIKYKNEKFEAEIQNTRVGKLLKNTVYGKYAFENMSLYDTNEFIDGSLKNCQIIFIIVYNSKNYGVWFCNKDQTVRISSKYDINIKLKFAIKTDDHNSETLISSFRNNPYLKLVGNSFKDGLLRFENNDVKNQLMEVLRKCLY